MFGPGKDQDLDQELDNCRVEATGALKKFLVGWWVGWGGGLFDYSVYSWPSSKPKIA